MGKTIIAVSGWAKSGKDTLADFLIKERGAKRIAFADPLKAAVGEDFNLSTDFLYDQDKKEKPLYDLPVEPKDEFSLMIAQYLVKEFRTWTGQIPDSFMHVVSSSNSSSAKRFVGILNGDRVKLFWTPRALMIAEGSIKRSVDSNFWVKKAISSSTEGLFVISDLRYKSELSGIKKYMNPNDTLITIRIERFETTQSQDSSERDLDDAEFDYVIENKGTLKEYIQKIDNILKERGM